MYFIDDLLKKAYEERASDLLISVDSPPIYRVHGELIHFGEPPLAADDNNLDQINHLPNTLMLGSLLIKKL